MQRYKTRRKHEHRSDILKLGTIEQRISHLQPGISPAQWQRCATELKQLCQEVANITKRNDNETITRHMQLLKKTLTGIEKYTANIPNDIKDRREQAERYKQLLRIATQLVERIRSSYTSNLSSNSR